jgi:hypothetical protein
LHQELDEPIGERALAGSGRPGHANADGFADARIEPIQYGEGFGSTLFDDADQARCRPLASFVEAQQQVVE